jgi:hypothetical protein
VGCPALIRPGIFASGGGRVLRSTSRPSGVSHGIAASSPAESVQAPKAVTVNSGVAGDPEQRTSRPSGGACDAGIGEAIDPAAGRRPIAATPSSMTRSGKPISIRYFVWCTCTAYANRPRNSRRRSTRSGRCATRARASSPLPPSCGRRCWRCGRRASQIASIDRMLHAAAIQNAAE